MSGHFLVDHPNPVCPQWRTPRRAPLSGTVGVHTCEGVMDNVGVDTGAENVASWISTRSDYGSYHVIVDSDSTVDCVPDDYEAWHIAESDAFGAGMNSHSWGVSAACRTVDWNPDDPWTQATILRMGQAVAAFWRRNGFDPLDPNICRFLTRDEAKRRTPGLVLHGVVQPGDRSDAWRDHPRRAQLEAMLLAAIRGTTPGPTPSPSPIPPAIKDHDMNTIIWIETKSGAYVYDPHAGTGRNINPDEVEVLKAAGWPEKRYPAGGAMHRILDSGVRKINYSTVG